jgi:hypothetical protein
MEVRCDYTVRNAISGVTQFCSYEADEVPNPENGSSIRFTGVIVGHECHPNDTVVHARGDFGGIRD